MRTDPLPESAVGSSGVARQMLRREALARRTALTPAEHGQRSQAICHHLVANFPQLASLQVGFCWPVNQEPDVRAALAAWRDAGDSAFAALLPVVLSTDAPLAFRDWHPGTVLMTDRYGIPSPAEGHFLQPQALLIPLLAFDAAGFRLGYGGGYFDRTLADSYPRPLAIGVGFELCRVATVHPQAHDERLDAVVTEAGVTRFVREKSAFGGVDQEGGLASA